MKKIILSFFIVSLTKINTFAEGAKVYCDGLPGCDSSGNGDGEIVVKASANIIATIIKFVAVFAVIALMISGIMYMLSSGEEDKTKKAKNWIIWSLVGVILSTSAYYIVGVIDNAKIG